MKPKKKIHQYDLIATAGVVYEYEEITGNLDARNANANAFPNLTTIGGDANFEGWSGSADKLTTIGGDANFEGWSGSADKLTTNDPSACDKCRRSIFDANLKIGYYFADGILAKLANRKGRVARVVICGNTATSYVVDDGNGNYSPAATLDEARRGLIYKLSNRDTTPLKKWTQNTVVSVADAIRAYRAITGACEAGTRQFCETGGKLPDKLTIADAIKRTKGQYGADVFAKFFAA